MKKFSRVSILVCTHVHMGLKNKSCGGELSLAIVEKLKQLVIEQKLDVSVREQACFGRCDEGIVARIYPSKEYFLPVAECSLVELIELAKCNVELESK